MPFDLDGARKAGHSDVDIVDFLAQQSNFNAKQARSAGYSDAELLTHLVGAPAPAPVATPKMSAADTPGIVPTLAIGAGKTFDSIMDGLTQAWLGAKGDDKALSGLKENVDEKARLYKPLQEARPIATAVGESLPSMVLPGGASKNAITAAAKLAGSAAVPAALEYGTVGERAQRAAVSGAGAVIGGLVVPKAAQLVGEGVRRGTRAMMGNVTPEVAALAARAEALGVPVSAAQLSDSKFVKTLASATENLPLSGASKTMDDQRRAFTRAVSRTFGDDTDNISQAVYKSNRDRLGREFDRLSAQNNLQVSPALLSDIGQVSHEATKFASNDTTKAVKNAIDELMSKMDPATGVIPGKAYSSLDSKLSRLQKSGAESGVYLGQLQDALRTAMDHSIAPADQAAWQAARSQYRNLKAIRDLVAKDGANGEISPAGLMSRLTNNEASKNTMAAGTRGDLGDIARAGTQFIKDKVPNSGTAQRLMAQSVLTTGLVGSGYLAGADPMTMVGLAGAGATSGRLANKILNSPASGKRLLATPQKISDLLMTAPGRAAQVMGGGTGMTIADLVNR
jgi:hypothetical protein